MESLSLPVKSTKPYIMVTSASLQRPVYIYKLSVSSQKSAPTTFRCTASRHWFAIPCYWPLYLGFMRNKRRWASSSPGTIGGKIPAFIILTNDRGDTGDGQEDREERGRRIQSEWRNARTESTPFWRGWPTICRLSRRSTPSSIPLFLASFLFPFRDFLDPSHPLTLFSSLSHRLFGAVLPYFFRWGDTTQLPEKTLRQFPTGEPISIIAGVLHLAGENPLLDRPLS